MKVCLITPPSGFLLDQRVFVSLGILKVGAVLEHAGYEVEHLDLSGVQNYEDVCRDYVDRNCFGGSLYRNVVFCLTATTPQIPAALKIRRTLRGKTILGGPHPTLLSAAAKRGNQRAIVGLASLLENFDCIVAGDGEKAIFRALREYGLIDADDPKSELWQQNNFMSPWPARHLVDIDSYHYSVDGERALSLIAQLGCLAPDTPILLESGACLPISDVQTGQRVRCYDEANNRWTIQPVTATWQREACDLWEVEWDNGAVLRITGEHPIYTRDGWKTVDSIQVGWFSASVYGVPQGISSNSPGSTGKVLQSSMSCDVAEGERKPRLAKGGPKVHTSEVCFYDDATAKALLHDSKGEPASESNAQNTATDFRIEERDAQPHEAPRGRDESVRDNQKTMGQILLRANEEELAGRQTIFQSESTSQRFPQQARDCSSRDSLRDPTRISVRGECPILDWPLSLWKTSQSRFFRPWFSQGHSVAWRVLAQPIIGANRKQGLPREGLDAASGMESRIGYQEQDEVKGKAEIVWSKIVSKTFIGLGTVHNITIHPIHNYVANGMLVHNCPFSCNFCGGRASPMLRRARNREFPIDIIAEMVHLYDAYGVKGMMFLDDELNINKGIVPLMRGIAATGIDWRLRGFVKAELFTEEQAQVMYAAGFRWLLCGFESAHPRILRNINKKATLADNTNMLRIAHKNGLKVKALMSIGHPGESEESVLAIRDWLLEEKPDDFDCTIITVYPGVPYNDSAIDLDSKTCKYTIHDDALYFDNLDFTKDEAYYKGKSGDYRAFVWTDHLSRERLVQMRDELEDEVRKKLNIPYPSSPAALLYEASMGQLPSSILRKSSAKAGA